MRNTILLIAGICFLIAGSSIAFHDGGVAHCNGCHTMHNSQDGALVDPNSPGGNAWLLNDGTPSDVCLNCHSHGSYSVLGADPLTPTPERGAGDFVFLLEDNIDDGHGGGDTLADGSWADPMPGYKAGHSIVAPGHGLDADPTAFPGNAGPGGSFSKFNLGCSSCHDPHGNENFRLLYGVGDVQDGAFTFTKPAPVATGLSVFFGNEAMNMWTAYESGMSNWCGNCHAGMHTNTSGGNLVHPSGMPLGGTIAGAYGLYNGSDDQTGGAPALSYIPEVAFEEVGRTVSSTAGPGAGARVSCITCHRAHATSSPDAGRWDFNVTLLVEDADESGSYEIPNPYSDNQRSLCNKCHVKDAGDHMPF